MNAVLSHVMARQISPVISLAEGAEMSETETRILDATLACISRVGLNKTTLDDVAREAGCSRATLYRYFPGKQPLARAVVVREAQALGRTLQAATSDCTTLEDAVVELILTAVRT